MIVKIQPPSRDLENALRYNERKTGGREYLLDDTNTKNYLESDNAGHILATRNVPEGSTLEEEFARLHMLNLKTRRKRALQNETFHMSINPGDGDRPLSESELLAFADRLMSSLGYGACPYRVYRHDDIQRTHYHVVATRIGQDGLKVDDRFEHRRCRDIVISLQEEFGFTYGQSHENRREAKGKKEKAYVKPFSRSSATPISEQFRTFHEEAMSWHFTTLAEYAAIMRRRFMTETAVYEDGLHFWGLDRNGRKTTKGVTESELGVAALRGITEKADNMKPLRRQRVRLETCVGEALEEASSWDEFRSLLREKGIAMVLAWSEMDEPFGVTWLDRATRCAWKGSQTSCDLTRLREAAAAKGWTITRDPVHERKPGRARKVRIGGTTNSPYGYDSEERMRDLKNSAAASRRDNTSASHNRGEIEDDVRKTGIKL